MKKQKSKDKMHLVIISIPMVAFLGVSFVAAFPFGKGFMNPDLSDVEIQELQENHEAVKTAIENQDFDSWKSLMEEKINKMQESLTKEDFNKIVEKHQSRAQFRESMQEAHESGDFSKVQELKEKLGFKDKHFKMDFRKDGFKNCNLNLEE